MPLQLAVSTPEGMVAEHLLFEGQPYHIGRAETADIVIDHPQVSRRHAILSNNDDKQWALNDTSSTGCFCDGERVTLLPIGDEQSISIGPVACRLKPISNLDVEKVESQQIWRKLQLRRYRSQLNESDDSISLIQVARECMLQSLGCERAALILLDEQTGFQQGLGYEPWMDAEGFSGSRTVIKNVIKTRTPLALGNLKADQRYALQASVIQNNILAALCVPILVENQVVGVLYGDNTIGRQYFTETDVSFAVSMANFLSLRLLFHSIDHKISLLHRS
ncbi:FHA domain-containing protein [Alteromonas sp. ASW11-130]|uniref:FHA domain-containing protein n=1 Tax=Alteromonas sp. ASW11-130 TaxID=3015775 RepID=UPI0022423406|nr:FHA domain-containing protein [Alteromonas sp. ASW11-130]MCW8092607.1 FHA domain-containing protein [Alteromonas sp. ASW11-130]